MPAPEARTPQQRMQDVLHRFENDIDCWVATADPDAGAPYLVPLSHWWNGETLLLATTRTNPTAVNLQSTGAVRLAFGHTRDVVLVHGTVARSPAMAARSPSRPPRSASSGSATCSPV